MMEFIRRGVENPQPLGDLPVWLSTLLRSRGVDTPEKAHRFLHPSLDQLHDPFLMQDMDKAVAIIRQAVADRAPIVVYGDYDVDGVSACSIMLETLREMDAVVDFRIPRRHEEGYGLNCAAVREMAQQYRLMITVDCGVTNHEEVALARQLGMVVVVTDHHQPAPTPSPADAVLNPLLGDYPFRRLCGAGVALKLTQALIGMEGVERRIELAALATVADVVPLIDENRVIVREGLRRMEQTRRPGLKALLTLSGVEGAINTGHVGFRLAPRINAGGRLEDASRGVHLLTTQDETEAMAIAMHLEETNQQRQAIEQDITQEAIARIEESVDFFRDRVIIVHGEGWNHGVIGLAAGRICEKYHFPAIVLTVEDGVAVGSCRSIPGVNIHAMLTTCRDLFTRFGGHEQAAGLTMPAERIGELRRRLNLAIDENCDLRCYIPTREYDLTVRLGDVDLDMVDRLSLLQPTGYGNPNPVFLVCGAELQHARRVGKSQTHLQLSLSEGSAIRKGIAFGKGDVADAGYSRVDVLFTPDRNEFRGTVTPQLQVEAITPASGSIPLPEENLLFRRELQDLLQLAEHDQAVQPGEAAEPVTMAALRQLLSSGHGVLVLAHVRQSAVRLLTECPMDADVGQVKDPRGFNTVLMAPDYAALQDVWTDVVLLDGPGLPGEAALVRRACPRARLLALKGAQGALEMARGLAMEDEPLRGLYRRIRSGCDAAPGQLAEDTGLTMPQVLCGLAAFRQVGLVRFSAEPFALSLLPPVKCRMEDSSLVRYLRAAARG